jgi:hypothetical protein
MSRAAKLTICSMWLRAWAMWAFGPTTTIIPAQFTISLRAANDYNYPGPIHYILASGDGEDGNIKRFFASAWNDEPTQRLFRLTKEISPTGYELRSAQAEPCLQAADIAAYKFNKLAMHCLENNYELDPNAARKSVVNLCREPNNNLPLLLPGERMKQAFDAMVAAKKRRPRSDDQS